MFETKPPSADDIRAWQKTPAAYETFVRVRRVVYAIPAVIAQVPLVILDTLFNTNMYGRPSWGIGYRLLRLAFSYFLWSTNPGTRPPADVVSPAARAAIPKLSAGQHAHLVTVPARPDKIRGDIAHPDIIPEECPCFWQWVDPMPSPVEAGTSGPEANKNRKVLVYFVGGAMVQGHPVSPIPMIWNVLGQTQIPVFGVNFRKAVTAKTAFPAAVQDAVAAFFYLLDQGFEAENICLLGDSGGAAIIFTTLLYLKQQKMTLPGSTIMVCPWVDLLDTYQGDKYKEARKLDILNVGMLGMAAYQYTENRPDLRGTLLSPSRNELPEGYSFEGLPRTMLVYGEVELFAQNLKDMAKILKENKVQVEVVVGKDDIHVYPALSKDFSENSFYGRLLPFLNNEGKYL